MELRRWVRAVVVGRPDGIRAAVRRETGWFTWLDEDRSAPPPTRAAAPTSAPADDAGDWVEVIAAEELAPGVPIEVFVQGEPVVVVRLDAGIFAVSGTCLHADGPLGEGFVEDGMITCPWHGWSYDLRTGATPMREGACLRTYAVQETAGVVRVRV